MSLIKRMLFLTLVATCVACSVNPVTGKKEWSPLSPQGEVTLGEENYEPYQQQQGGRYVVDPDLNAYVNQVGQKLARVSDRPDLPYEFVVLNHSTPNAWALPGGKIAINRGLLNLLDDEAQLAAVLGHEIVHAAARHTAQKMAQSTYLQLGMAAAAAATQGSEYGQMVAVGAGLGANLWQARYGREQESEADRHGIKYMDKAGYDTQAAVELQEKFVALKEGQTGGMMEALFASHPPSEQRVAHNQELARAYSGGTRNKAAYQKAIAQIVKDKPAYDAHQQAMAAAQKNDMAAASRLIEQAISKQPNEALFHVARGQLRLNEDKNAAAQAFQQAVRLNPEYFMGHLGLGLAKLELKQHQEAERSLEASMKLLPTPLASYHLGELTLARGDRNKARSYFEFAAQGEGEIANAAKAQLGRMTPSN